MFARKTLIPRTEHPAISQTPHSGNIPPIHNVKQPNDRTSVPPPKPKYLAEPPPQPHQTWWRRSGSNRRPPACKAGALPTELRPRSARAMMVGPGRFELPTSRLSGVRSNQLSYEPGRQTGFQKPKLPLSSPRRDTWTAAQAAYERQKHSSEGPGKASFPRCP